MVSIFQIPDTRNSRAIFILLILLSVWVIFGSLSNHLFDAFDDREHIQDIKTGLQNPSFLFSSNRILPIRPPNDAIVMIAYMLWQDDPGSYHLLLVAIHSLNAILLFYFLKLFKIDIELRALASFLFLINVAHFRAVQWIICMDRVLALTWSFAVITCFITYLKTTKRKHLIVASAILPIAIFSHPTAVSIVPFCTYLYWHQMRSSCIQALKKTWPLWILAPLFGLLAYLVSPDHNQTQGLVNNPSPVSTS